ncbi:MAG: addiction module protein [Hydrogenophilales bacterium CG_4_10_14_3_um_filter_63_21]|nr:MAG: addiction module protein [Hydrogenophilales bacterium CG_4_10_14_3_um_filter_63_21]
MKTIELIAEAVALPVEERARVVENLLSSLNPPDQAVDAAWASVARRRLDDLRSGRVEAIPGEVVFERIRQRYSK